MKIFVWIVATFFSGIGFVVFVAGLLTAISAPQESAVATVGLALAAIPYIGASAFCRLLDSFKRDRSVIIPPLPRR